MMNYLYYKSGRWKKISYSYKGTWRNCRKSSL